MVADPSAVEDVIQEATLAAWLNLDYLRNPERFGSWWCGIVLNHARRYLTARRAQDRALLTGLEPEPSDDGGSGPEHQVEQAELSERVRAAVAALPQSQRSAAYRFYLQGLSYREAAEELGISVNTLKARLHQGRKALRRSLDDLGPKEAVMSGTEEFVPVEIVDVRQGAGSAALGVVGPHIVILKANESDRYVAVFISAAEGTPLALSLEEMEMPRPLTHQLAARLVAGCGGEIVGVSITRLVEAVYYATIILETRQGTQEVDARPSDALNLAALTGAPITVEASLLFESEEDDAAWKDLPGREQIAREARERHDEILRVARGRHTAQHES
jgi:RNA polymerase sigma factor (sigma-70 family)